MTMGRILLEDDGVPTKMPRDISRDAKKKFSWGANKDVGWWKAYYEKTLRYCGGVGKDIKGY